MDAPGRENRPQSPLSRDPFHVPDRRWKRVLELSEGSKRPRRPESWDDSYVRTMRAFIMRTKGLSVKGLQRLRDQSPGLAGALRIHGDDDSRQRLEIQCRILAGQSDAEIAHLLGCLPEVVTWYAKIFFDVRDCLPHRDWILCNVTGMACFPHDFGLDGIKKRLSYLGGPLLAEAVLAVEPDFQPPQKISELRRLITSPMGEGAAVRAWLAVEMFAVTNRNVVQFLQLARKVAARMDTDAPSKETWKLQARAVRETIAEIERIKNLAPMTLEQLDKIKSVKMPPPRTHLSAPRAKS
jgi:hypothetical protein